MRFARQKAELKAEFDGKVGFRAVFNTLGEQCRERGMPIVVHNGIMDVLFVLAAFETGRGNLPAEWKEAKKLINAVFPVLYDTKYLGHLLNRRDRFYRNLNLSACYDDLKGEEEYHRRLSQQQQQQQQQGDVASQPQLPPLSVTFAPGFDAYTAPSASASASGSRPSAAGSSPVVPAVAAAASAVSNPRLHEAGYDAFATGFVFQALQSKLLRIVDVPSHLVGASNAARVSAKEMNFPLPASKSAPFEDDNLGHPLLTGDCGGGSNSSPGVVAREYPFGLNRLFLMRSVFSIDTSASISLRDPLVGGYTPRSVFLVSNIPKGVRVGQILDCVKSVPAPAASGALPFVEVQTVSETEALVCVGEGFANRRAGVEPTTEDDKAKYGDLCVKALQKTFSGITAERWDEVERKKGEADQQEEEEAQKPGFFKRLIGMVGGSFRRSYSDGGSEASSEGESKKRRLNE